MSSLKEQTQTVSKGSDDSIPSHRDQHPLPIMIPNVARCGTGRKRIHTARPQRPSELVRSEPTCNWCDSQSFPSLTACQGKSSCWQQTGTGMPKGERWVGKQDAALILQQWVARETNCALGGLHFSASGATGGLEIIPQSHQLPLPRGGVERLENNLHPHRRLAGNLIQHVGCNRRPSCVAHLSSELRHSFHATPWFKEEEEKTAQPPDLFSIVT
jgi:hypothetical protein